MQIRRVLFTVLLAPLAVGVSAARVVPQADVTSTLIDAPRLLSDLKTLSADDMQGRQVDTPGGAKARAFVIERFKESGIKPFGASYEEPFTYTAGRNAAG